MLTWFPLTVISPIFGVPDGVHMCSWQVPSPPWVKEQELPWNQTINHMKKWFLLISGPGPDSLDSKHRHCHQGKELHRHSHSTQCHGSLRAGDSLQFNFFSRAQHCKNSNGCPWLQVTINFFPQLIIQNTPSCCEWGWQVCENTLPDKWSAVQLIWYPYDMSSTKRH